MRLLIGLISLGAVRGGQPQIWRQVTSTLARFAPNDRYREVGSSIDDALSDFIAELRRWFGATPLDEGATTGLDVDVAAALVDKLTAFVKYDDIAQKRALADRPEDLAVTLEAFRVRLANVFGRVDSWNQVSGAFTDDEAVPLLTIHRSKGLEYHTVFFVGLDGDQWWAHARDTIESTMAFFVGVSRAAERLIFTQCDQRGSTHGIADLYEGLDHAGVPVVRMG